MTITQFKYIVAVDNHRHFAKAAEACFVTQPTLSMQIQKLEEELDILIFDRSKHPIVPTPLGNVSLNKREKYCTKAPCWRVWPNALKALMKAH